MKEAEVRIKVNTLQQAARSRVFAGVADPVNIQRDPTVKLVQSDLDDFNRYEFDPDESTVIITTRKLIWRLALSSLCVKSSEIIIIGKLFRVLQRLPEVAMGENLRVSLTGSRRMFGAHEIFHYWEISVEDNGLLSISAAGGSYCPETDSDSFTSMSWGVSPGYESDEASFLDTLYIVDDAALLRTRSLPWTSPNLVILFKWRMICSKAGLTRTRKTMTRTLRI